MLGNRVMKIKIDLIRQSTVQPRKDFNEEELRALAESIRANGILQPLTIRKADGGYELIAGERRLRAARLAGLAKVPCIFVNASEQQASILALIENIQRSDLNFFEEAEGYRRLVAEYGMTQSEIAKLIGKQQSTIANKLRLLRLDPVTRFKILSSGMTERHARTLLQIEQEPIRQKLLDAVISGGLNVQQTEQLAEKLMIEDKGASLRQKPLIRDIRLFINTIDHAVAVMKLSGINAGLTKNESDEAIEYSIVIPKLRKNA